MAALMYGAGLRVNECCHLRVQDIDFAARTVRVHSGKGDKSRLTVLPMVLAPRLGAGEDEAFDDVLADDVTFDDVKSEAAAESAESDKPAAAPPSAPAMRFLMLAASVAFAAAFGSFVGSMSGSGLAFHFGASSSAAGRPGGYSTASNSGALGDVRLPPDTPRWQLACRPWCH